MAGVPSPITQTGRLLSISITTLDFDTLLIESFTGEEGISRPFRFVAELLADVQFGRDQEVRPEELIGEMATIRIASRRMCFSLSILSVARWVFWTNRMAGKTILRGLVRRMRWIRIGAAAAEAP